MKPFLEVRKLSVAFPTEDGVVQATNDISFELALGETLAIVGESGSGKSVSNMAIMGLHNPKSTRITGEALLNLETGPLDVISAPAETVRKLRGATMSMIFQDPMSALHPYFKIGDQITEAWLLHNDGRMADARKAAIEMLDLVGIPDAKNRVDEYPHQFSGGMRQRALIAMALINHPKILIADEPTTALDVTVQSQILQLLRDIQKEFNMGIILITHDLGVVAEVADRINIMYAGRLIEDGTVDDVFANPTHPYTNGLLASVPRVDRKHSNRLKAIGGQPPSLINLPEGCAFAPRCSYAKFAPSGLCETQLPSWETKRPEHHARCHLSAEKVNELSRVM